MGAKRITPEEIEKMILLYDKLGTYAAVAREIKRSPDSVAKYMENAKDELSNRVQHSIICRVFLRLPLDREEQFSAEFALLVVAMQEQRRRAGSVFQTLAASFALRIALCNTFPPSHWLCEPISGIFTLFLCTHSQVLALLSSCSYGGSK